MVTYCDLLNFMQRLRLHGGNKAQHTSLLLPGDFPPTNSSSSLLCKVEDGKSMSNSLKKASISNTKSKIKSLNFYFKSEFFRI